MKKVIKSLPWDEVEKQISKEINWLRVSIERFFEKERDFCNECLFRQIAILIVSGQVVVAEIEQKPSGKGFWLPFKSTGGGRIYHGQDWHRNTLEKIESHFSQQGFNVVREPNIHRGRADLGVYKPGKHDLIIEVGTVSLFKLWLNLRTMRNSVFLVVPNDDKIIEFRVIN